MKRITLTIVLLITINLSAQSWFGVKEKVKGNKVVTTIKRNVNEYDKIKVAGSFNIELIRGKEGKLIIDIEENLKDYLVTKIKGETLVIRWKKEYKVLPKKTVRIQIPFEEIEAVTLAGSGAITNADLINSQDFGIELAGSGVIDLEINTISLDCSMAGSGTVKLKGNSTDFDCSKAGSGILNSYNFICKDVDISSAGSGHAEVYASESLEAESAGSGSIYYKGNPKKDSIKVAGSGKIVMK